VVKENPEILQGKGISTKKYAYITSLFTAVESLWENPFVMKIFRNSNQNFSSNGKSPM